MPLASVNATSSFSATQTYGVNQNNSQARLQAAQNVRAAQAEEQQAQQRADAASVQANAAQQRLREAKTEQQEAAQEVRKAQTEETQASRQLQTAKSEQRQTTTPASSSTATPATQSTTRNEPTPSQVNTTEVLERRNNVENINATLVVQRAAQKIGSTIDTVA